jgi:kynurenine formamidase
LVKLGKSYALGVETGPDSPAYSPRTYSVTVLQLDDGMGTPMGTNKATGNDDLMTFWMGIGSQIDGLGHMGENHRYYNGNLARDFVTPTGLTKLSIDKLPPIASRGVLLDMAKLMGEAILPEGTAFNSAEIKAAAKAANITIEAGDVVLFHTGWMNVMESDPKRFMAGEPGLGMDGAQYLASLGVAAVGSDTWGLEVLPGENATELFPVHPHLLAKNGVYILENMDTRALAADGATEFLFVLGVPRFVGAVQAVINPIAIR